MRCNKNSGIHVQSTLVLLTLASGKIYDKLDSAVLIEAEQAAYNPKNHKIAL